MERDRGVKYDGDLLNGDFCIICSGNCECVFSWGGDININWYRDEYRRGKECVRKLIRCIRIYDRRYWNSSYYVLLCRLLWIFKYIFWEDEYYWIFLEWVLDYIKFRIFKVVLWIF